LVILFASLRLCVFALKKIRPQVAWLGLAAMIVGAWGPWVAHANAGMALGVSDLVEFVKFMQRAGLTAIGREWFYLPLLAAALGLSLGARQRFAVSDFRFWVVSGAAILAALEPLPPYPFVFTAYQSPEDRTLFWMSVIALGLVVAALGAGNRLPRRTVARLITALAVCSVPPAVWQFVQLRGPLAELYGAPVQAGWGLIVTVAGSLLVIVGTQPPSER
jgi:hypothetical protein